MKTSRATTATPKSVLAAVAATALVLSGCNGSGDEADQSVDPKATKAPSKSLAKFYDQKLSWTDCEEGAQCAQLEVPIDYSQPSGGTLKVAVLKRKATGQRRGSLVVNPGGPGGSGVDYAAAADFIVSRDVRKAYDVVGFDPRGVQRSAPIVCYDAPKMDGQLGGDPTPDDSTEQNAMMKSGRDFGSACKKKAPELIGHVSTVEAAKDMDVLRAALGSSKLDYLGKSYGTFLGATYADLFPKKVGRFVLDGVVPPDITNSQVNQGQADGFERATKAYVKDCVDSGDCPLGGSEKEGMKRIRDFLKEVDAKPIPVTNDERVKKLTEGWASSGIAAAMYDQGMWGSLTKAFKSAFAGNGNDLMALANSYSERDSEGNYSSNIMQVISAVNCLDRQGSPDVADYRKDQANFTKTAPTWGPLLAWGGAVCGEWPVKATGKPKKITAQGSSPILVIGTTRDPATPYEWSVRLNNMLDNSRLISWDGDGHTAYMRSNKCVDGATDKYLLEGKVPDKKDTKC
ncbi:alpha/beta hydrolase [Demetria terragena]|uniref:alpha/beta hydrolase n=1 Tax=Demetria terragena TaxID=63959 RepID=UPI0003799CC9|nr:alpha/beta hydrolase [Demetria terragena]